MQAPCRVLYIADGMVGSAVDILGGSIGVGSRVGMSGHVISLGFGIRRSVVIWRSLCLISGGRAESST